MVRQLSLSDKLSLLAMLSANIVSELQTEWPDNLWLDDPEENDKTPVQSQKWVVSFETLLKQD
jgi:hypothetical protein